MERFTIFQKILLYLAIAVFMTFILLPFFEMFMASLRPLQHLFRSPYQFWSDDMSFQAYKASFSLAVFMNVSAYTSGNFAISSVQVTMKVIGGGEGDQVIVDKIINPGMANMTSATSQIAILNVDTKTSAKIPDKPVSIQVKVNTSSGTGTYQCGIVPIFCYLAAAVPKTWTTSSVVVHAHADLAHAFPIFRDEDNMNMLDRSGIGL